MLAVFVTTMANAQTVPHWETSVLFKKHCSFSGLTQKGNSTPHNRGCGDGLCIIAGMQCMQCKRMSACAAKDP